MHDVDRNSILRKDWDERARKYGPHPHKHSHAQQHKHDHHDDHHEHYHNPSYHFFSRYKEFITPLICLLLVITAWIVGEHSSAGTWTALAAVAIAGYPICKNAVVSSINKGKLNAEVLVAIALIASVWVGEYIAGALVALMMLTGELLEELTIAKTSQAIRALMDLSPDTATVIRDGKEMELPIEEVNIGDIALVQPGEKIPVDGVVCEGRGEVDQAAITGESIPVIKEPGSDVYGGTFNQLGALKIEVSRIGEETTLSRIIQLVQQAQAEKPPIERIADKFSAWFTPVMLALAALTWGLSGEILRGVTVLVVACPCALVIATPTAVVAGIGNAARKGILIKGGAVLETISKLNVFAFDKTGTLTFGEPQVHTVQGFAGTTENEVLQLAASAEKNSGHPLAEAVLRCANEKNLKYPLPAETQVIVGRGVEAVIRVDGEAEQRILVGNSALFKEKGIAANSEATELVEKANKNGLTGVLVAIDNQLIGGITIADTLRPEVKQSVDTLRELEIERVIMLTGDTEAVAKTIMHNANFDEIAADLLPEQKLNYIKRIQKTGKTVAMVGDGINDSPALVAADVGIAMGIAGTDSAIEAADIALTTDSLDRITEAIALSRQTITIIKQSFFVSIAINVIALILASTGGIGPVAGAFIHNIGSVIVVGNSSRLIGYNYKKNTVVKKG